MQYQKIFSMFSYATKRRILTNTLQLSTQLDTLQFSKQTPYSSQLNQTPCDTPIKLIISGKLNQTTCNSPNKLLTTLNSIKHLTILLTNSLQLSTYSDTLQFPNKLNTALNLFRHLTIFLTNSIQLSTQSDIL